MSSKGGQVHTEFLNQAKAAIEEHDVEKFLKSIAIAEYLVQDDPEQSELVKLEQINGLYELGLYGNIIGYIDEQLSNDEHESEKRLELIRKKGVVFGWLGYYDDAISIFEKFLQDENLKGQVIGYGNLVWLLLYKYEITKDEALLSMAEEYCEKGVELAEDLKNEEIYRDLINNLGRVYWENAKYELALVTFLKIEEKYHNAVLLNNIAATYVSLKDGKTANMYLNRALDYAIENKDNFAIGQNNWIRGMIEEEINEDYLKAKDYYLVAFDDFTGINVFHEACICFDNIIRMSELLSRESINLMASKFTSHLREINLKKLYNYC